MDSTSSATTYGPVSLTDRLVYSPDLWPALITVAGAELFWRGIHTLPLSLALVAAQPIVEQMEQPDPPAQQPGNVWVLNAPPSGSIVSTASAVLPGSVLAIRVRNLSSNTATR